MKDLPPVKWESISDPYAKFEASLPFNRIKTKSMIEKIDQAVLETQQSNNLGRGRIAREGEELPNFVTIQALRKVLTSNAWSPLNDPESRLCQTLLSE